MRLLIPVERDDLSTSGRVRRSGASVLNRIRQPARLSIGVAGVLGGALLLAVNIASILVIGGSALSWVPLTANAALIFGGFMFFREYRRAARQEKGQAGRSPDAG